jgi:hypothetical protein
LKKDAEITRLDIFIKLGNQAIYVNKDIMHEDKKLIVALYQQQLFP